jgi:hypothetical protein
MLPLPEGRTAKAWEPPIKMILFLLSQQIVLLFFHDLYFHQFFYYTFLILFLIL